MKEYKSVCPYDCPDACGLIVSVENNKVVSVRGNKEHAFTRGTLCPKMVHYEKVIHSPLRLEYPMKRIGKKGHRRNRIAKRHHYFDIILCQNLHC